jgi:microcin C transport system substrate-binding protein
MKPLLYSLALCIPLCLTLPSLTIAAETPSIAMHGNPKYSTTFKNFDYVNPNAPKGGNVVLSSIGTFDSLNPFILKGNPADGIMMLFDTLTKQSSDEAFSGYGLLAEKITVAKDRSWVEFTLRPEARFFDGSPVTADDVLFTFDTLKAKGQPFYRSYYSAVTKAEKTGALSVKFSFNDANNRELPLIMGQMPVLSKNYYKTVSFEKTSLEPPMGSGAYKVADVKAGRSITYKRNDKYWAANLPVNKGYNNFETIRYDYYRDATVALEAFKAGAYDFRLENIAKNWATAYNFPAVQNQQVLRAEIPNQIPSGMQGFVFNLRKPLFQDIRVREALNYAFDFEWMNKNLFYSTYKRNNSYFTNSDLASVGIPTGKELEILTPFKDKLPQMLFEQPFKLPMNDTPNSLRYNLRKAQTLLEQAGWTIKDGVLVDKAGKPFTFEILLDNPAFERVAAPFIQNLQRLGIKATMRVIDAAQFATRIKSFQYEMTLASFGQSLSPGNEQRSYWASAEADVNGSRNVAGIKNPIVDALVTRIIAATDRDDLIAATKALDRVLLWNHYIIPQWHLGRFRIAYWDKFGRPAVVPPYSLGFPETWWGK